MFNLKKRRRYNCLSAVALLVLFVAAGSPQKALCASANLDQVRNGSRNSPVDPPDWVNGNANATQAHYVEGHSIPYRVLLKDLSIGAHCLIVEWDISHSGKNAIDFITHYQRLLPHQSGHSAENVNPLRDYPIGSFGAPITFPIPTPVPLEMVSGLPQPQTSFLSLLPEERVMTIYNGTIDSLRYVNNDYGNLGDLNEIQSATRLHVDFTATNDTVLLVWGGHVSNRLDWGEGNTCAAITGSPYHMRLIYEVDSTGGGQDRSLQAATVVPTVVCGIAGLDVVCIGTDNACASIRDTSVYFYSWDLNSNTSGATIVGASDDSQVVINSGNSSGSFELCITNTRLSDLISSTCCVTVNSTDTSDLDGDGVLHCQDNCPLDYNSSQEDANNDGIGDACCCISNRGDVNYDGADANILDLNFLVNRIFRSGANPGCPDEADVNSDETSANILDLNFLVNRIFRGGADPGPCI